MEEIFSEFRSGKRTTGTWLSKSVLWQIIRVTEEYSKVVDYKV